MTEKNYGDKKKIAIQGKDPNGKWSWKPLAYRESSICHLCVILPPEIRVNLVLKHIHTANSRQTAIVATDNYCGDRQPRWRQITTVVIGRLCIFSFKLMWL